MKNRRNYYRILQVQPDAPAEIIRASYHALMRDLKRHPDLGGSTVDASLLNEAYETLSDPVRRAAYDNEMRARHFRRAAPLSKDENAQPPQSLCPFCKTRLPHQPQRGQSCPTCKLPLPFFEQTDMEKAGRRTVARMAKKGRIFYCSSLTESPKEAQMMDLSPKGMRFSCSERLRPGTVLKITSPQLMACGIVTNLKNEETKSPRHYEVGISFIAVKFKESKGSFVSLSG
jgi:curved DNA-binding protein CbpA